MPADHKTHGADAERELAEAGEAPTPLRAWQMACADVDRATQQSGLTRTFEADPAERAAVAEALDLRQCFMVRATLTFRARAGGRYAVQGRLQAQIEQTCVVTLEPVPAELDEPVACEFCPAADLPALDAQDPHFDPDSEDEPLAIVDGALPIGQFIYEQLALAVDPFPRAADAEDLDLERGPDGRTLAGQRPAAGTQNPFAVLAKLKPDKTD